MNFPRPVEDNGRGIHGDSHCGNPQWREDLALAKQMGAKWYKVVAAGNNALEFCKALLDNGIMPVVRLWRDRPNPGPLPDADRKAVSEYAKIGVRYFETNNEPNLGGEWRMPIPALEKGADYVVEGFLADQRVVSDAGGHLIFPAPAPVPDAHGGPEWPSRPYWEACMKRLGPQSLDIVWGVHNYGFNHDLNGPDGIDDPCWYSSWRFPMAISEQLFGKPVHVMATEGGFGYGQWDNRYPVNDKNRVRALYVQAMEKILGETPYYMAFMPWLMRASSPGHSQDDVWAGNNRHVLEAVGQVKGVRSAPISVPGETDWHSPNHSSRQGLKPQWIVLHDTEGSLAATKAWFLNPKGASLVTEPAPSEEPLSAQSEPQVRCLQDTHAGRPSRGSANTR